MARCQQCNAVIVLGGARKDGARYCNSTCMKQNQRVRQTPVSDVQLEATVLAVHAGPCPVCQRDGPVDVHNVHTIWSVLWFTQWKTVPTVGCRSCGRMAQLRGVLFSSLLGWWGFPWGVIVTPIQILRNLGGMFLAPHSEHPSAQLQELLRGELAEQNASDPEGLSADELDVVVEGRDTSRIEVTCRACGHGFDVGTQMAGRTEYCPECGIGLTVSEAVETQLGTPAELPTIHQDERWSSQGEQAEREHADWDDDWSHPWDDQWGDIDGRYGQTGRKPTARESAMPGARGRKRPVLSLLTWIVVAVIGVSVLVGVIGFVLIGEDDRRNAARPPGFRLPQVPNHARRPQPFPDHGMRLPEFRQPLPQPRGMRPVDLGDGDPGDGDPGDGDLGDGDLGDGDLGGQQPRPDARPAEQRRTVRYIQTFRQRQAVIYERLATQNERTSAWYWKEAARIWLKLEQTDKALAAAGKSENAPPETRSARRTHLWHRHLGDIFLELGEPERAIPHYEQALKTTDILGSVEDVQKSLLQAIQRVNR